MRSQRGVLLVSLILLPQALSAQPAQGPLTKSMVECVNLEIRRIIRRTMPEKWHEVYLRRDFVTAEKLAKSVFKENEKQIEDLCQTLS